MPPSIPHADRLVLRNATVPAAVTGEDSSGALRRSDLTLRGGRIEAVEAAGVAIDPAIASHECDGGLVLPACVDVHTHLDKGHIWPRKPNPDGSWLGALLAVGDDRTNNWSPEDLRRRMDFSLRTAYAHGTAGIRTHLDSVPPHHEITWDVFDAMREKWAGRVELQAVALIGPDQMLEPSILDDVARRTLASNGILGGSVADHPRACEAVFAAVEKAGDLGLDLDLHCDETGNPEANALRYLAEAVLETGFEGNVVAGHCCVLAVQEADWARVTIERAAEAGIAVVSLPMCNLYLQDRSPASETRTPRWRGVTLLKELKAAGVRVAIASDNTRDPFYAYGDLDGLEVLREGGRIVQFDHPADRAFQWVRAVGADAAALAGMNYKALIDAGQPADLVILRARNWTELMARPQSDRIVLRQGRPIEMSLPDYRELDDLMGVQ